MPPIQPPVKAYHPKTYYIGIDPGASGGLAIISGKCINCVPMPSTHRDIWDVFQSYLNYGKLFAVIEKVGGFMGGSDGDGGKKNIASGHTMFTFGFNTGMLHMALTAAGIPYEECAPQRWQKSLGITPRLKGKKKRLTHEDDPKIPYGTTKVKQVGGETKDQFKNRLKQKACQFFPEINVTLKTCDALLIALYCQRKMTGTL